MSIAPEKKFKQVPLCFVKSPLPMKRKLQAEFDTNEDTKCPKLDESTVIIVENNENMKKEDALVLETETSQDIDLTLQPDSTNLTDDSSDRPRSFVTCEELVSGTSSAPVVKKLTPKQLQKQLMAEKKRQEREKQKLEEKEMKEKKRLAELELKNEEKRKKEEEKRKLEEEKRAKDEEKRKLKEEEKRTKEEEKRAKEEEKRAKEEEKRAKEEEKRAKEEEKKAKIEEKRLKEEQERKKNEKTVAAFTNFFVTKSKTSNECEKNPTSCFRFMPFEVKEYVRLTNTARVILSNNQKVFLDNVLSKPYGTNLENLYLSALKLKKYKPGHSENTWPLSVNDDEDDSKIGEDAHSRYRCKLLQFAENRRPPYWGTWRKKSSVVKGRNPFSRDENFFDYNFDSEEEWQEEPEGESLRGSDDEKESADEYDVDKDFMVPHGYLSDEEIQAQAGDDAANTNKMKLELLEQEFEAELKEKTCRLKMRVYGCVWIPNNIGNDHIDDDLRLLLLMFRGMYDNERSPFTIQEDEKENSFVLNTTTIKNKPPIFPEQYIPDLIKITHGYNRHELKKLVLEFSSYLKDMGHDVVPSISIKLKVKKIASWLEDLNCWYVSDEVRKQHNLVELNHSERMWKYERKKFHPNLPEKYVPDLIQLYHGNKNRAKYLDLEFTNFLKERYPNEAEVSKKTIKKARKEICKWQHTSCCWFVPDEIRSLHNISESVNHVPQAQGTVKNIQKHDKSEKSAIISNGAANNIESPTRKLPSITKFLKVLTPAEKERQLKISSPGQKNELSSSDNSPAPSPQHLFHTSDPGEAIKKRAVLIPVKKEVKTNLFCSLSRITSTANVPSIATYLKPKTSLSVDNDTSKINAAKIKEMINTGNSLEEKESLNTTHKENTLDNAVLYHDATVYKNPPKQKDCSIETDDSKFSVEATEKIKSSSAEAIEKVIKATDTSDHAKHLKMINAVPESFGAGIEESNSKNSANVSVEVKDVETADVKPLLVEKNVTIRHGKKYATLIMVGKSKDQNPL